MFSESPEPSDQKRINVALTAANNEEDPDIRAMRIANAVYFAVHADEIRAIQARLREKGIVGPYRPTEDAVASP